MESSSCEIVEVEVVTSELVEAFGRLLPQLSPAGSAAPAVLGAADLQEIVGAAGTTLFIAREGTPPGSIVGSATLVVLRIPSGRRARLESVVVDEGARGRGVGEALCRAALARAAAAGVACVDLSSSPSRSAANRLYLRLGFEQRHTNVYRFPCPA